MSALTSLCHKLFFFTVITKEKKNLIFKKLFLTHSLLEPNMNSFCRQYRARLACTISSLQSNQTPSCLLADFKFPSLPPQNWKWTVPKLEDGQVYLRIPAGKGLSVVIILLITFVIWYWSYDQRLWKVNGALIEPLSGQHRKWLAIATSIEPGQPAHPCWLTNLRFSW